MKKILISFFFIINPLLMYCQDTVYSTFDRDDGIYYNPILDQTTCEPYDLPATWVDAVPSGFYGWYTHIGRGFWCTQYQLEDTVRLMVYGAAILRGTLPGDSVTGVCVMLKEDSVTGRLYISDTADHYMRTSYFTTSGIVKHRVGPGLTPFECIEDSIREKTAPAVEYYFPNPIEIHPSETFTIGYQQQSGTNYIRLTNMLCDLFHDYPKTNYSVVGGSGVKSGLLPDLGRDLQDDNFVYLYYPILTPPALDTIPDGSVSRPEVGYLDTVYAQLSWEPTEGSTAYQLMVTMPDGSEMVRNCLSTTYYLYDLEQGGHYTAKVRAQMHHRCYYHDTVFFGEWSDTVGFTVPTNEPVGIAPTGNPVGEVLLRPNPVHSLLTVEHPSMEQAVIEVLNTSGLCVMKVSVRECETVLDVSTLPKGSYLLRLYSGESMVFRTFVVE